MVEQRVIKLYTDTDANLSTLNPVLAKGQEVVVTDLSDANRIYRKIGDGIRAYNSIEFEHFLNNYDSSLNYAENDIIQSAGQFFISLADDNQGNAIPDASTSPPYTNAWWKILELGGSVAPFFTLGETVSQRDVLYLSTDGKAYIASNTDYDHKNVIGFAVTSGDADDEIKVLKVGSLIGFSGLVAGKAYYLGVDGGVVLKETVIKTSFLINLGIATSTTELDVKVGILEHSQPTPNLWSGLKGAWPFDEGQGLVVKDISGGDNDGVLSGFGPVAEYHFDGDLSDEQGGADLTIAPGTATYETGVVGQGAGGGSFEATGITPGLTGSVSFWANVNDGGVTTSLYMFDNLDASTDNVFLRTGLNKFEGYLRDVTDGHYYSFLSVPIIEDEFVHFVITWDNGTVKSYVNNVFSGTADAITTGWYPADQDFLLGVNYNSTGQVNDDFRIYDYALSEDEISALYNRPQEPSHWVDGVSGKALAFNGVGSLVTIPSGLPPGDITVSLWLKASKVGRRFIWCQFIGSNLRRYFAFAINDNIVFASRRADGTTHIASQIPAASWTENTLIHVVGVQDGLTTKIYLNGTLIDSDTHADIYTSFDDDGFFGGLSDSLWYDGTIDEPMIYNRALSDQEIQALYQNPALPQKSLITLNQIDQSAIDALKFAYETSLVGSLHRFPTYKNRPGYLPFAFDNAISQANYPELYAEVGDLYEAMHVAAGDDASGAGMFYPTPVPGYYSRTGLPDLSYASTDRSSNALINVTHHISRNGTPIKIIGDDVPAPLVSGTVYYVVVNSATSISFATTETNAIAGTVITLTDAGSGTFRLTQEGVQVDDAFQGHWHDFYFHTGPSEGGSAYNNIASTTADSKGPGKYNVRIPITDGVNGTPRTSNETRPVTTYEFGYIKSEMITPAGEPVSALRYDTGWVANSDWSNFIVDIVHNLNANMSDLMVKVLLSTDGTDANSFTVDTGMYNAYTAGADRAMGYTLYQTDLNTINLQGGANYFVRLFKGTGTGIPIASNPYYYKVVVTKPNLISTVSVPPVRSVTSNYTLAAQDSEIIEVTTGASDVTITLPDLATSRGKVKRIYKVDDGAGQVIIARAGSDTITRAGLTQVTLTSKGDFWGLRALTGKWELFEGFESGSLSAGTQFIKHYNSKMEQRKLSVLSGLSPNLLNGVYYVNFTFTYDISFIRVDTVDGAFRVAFAVSWIGYSSVINSTGVLTSFDFRGICSSSFLAAEYLVSIAGSWY